MTMFRISGGQKLVGEVDVAGSKNAALAILSAVVLTEGPIVLHRVPSIADVRIKADLLRRFGARIEFSEGTLTVDCSTIFDGHADEETVRAIRTSFYLLGPVLARIGRIEIPAPGGCKIGARPVDLHLKGLAAMGAEIELDGGVYRAKAATLHGASVYLDFPSAGATQHLMATAVLAKGETIIENAAMEPEVTALARFLTSMGAKIEGAGTSKITISGRKELSGTVFNIPADRMQAGTYMIAGAITRGSVQVNGILPEEHTAVVNKLIDCGADVEVKNDSIRVGASKRISGTRIKTMPHPGFPTDMQQPMSALLAVAKGASIVEETIYENRAGHVPELTRMGANIRVEGRSMFIQGVERLSGAHVVASDLRAGAALTIAALAAEGESTIRNVELVDRGYHSFESTLRTLGARIERAPLEPRQEIAP